VIFSFLVTVFQLQLQLQVVDIFLVTVTVTINENHTGLNIVSQLDFRVVFSLLCYSVWFQERYVVEMPQRPGSYNC